MLWKSDAGVNIPISLLNRESKQFSSRSLVITPGYISHADIDRRERFPFGERRINLQTNMTQKH